MKIFDAFKAIIQHVTLMTAQDIKFLSKACRTGDLKEVEHILSNKKFRVIELPVTSLLQTASSNGHIHILQYLLTSKDSKEFHNTSLNKPFESACMSGKKDIIEYFLNSDLIRKQISYSHMETEALAIAAQLVDIDIIELFVYEPKYRNKIDLHTHGDLLFTQLYNNSKTELLEFLIFDLNLEKTSYINGFMNASYIRKDEYHRKIMNMFEVKNLKNELEAKVDSSSPHTEKRKIKI